MVLSQSNDNRLCELEKAPTLSAKRRSHLRATSDRLKSVLDFEMKWSRGGLGRKLLVRNVLSALRRRFKATTEELAEIYDRAADFERVIIRLFHLDDARIPIRNPVEVH